MPLAGLAGAGMKKSEVTTPEPQVSAWSLFHHRGKGIYSHGILLFLALSLGASGQEAGLISHWTFDDPANLGKDSVSTNQGVVMGGAYSFASPRVGPGALAVNGTDGHIEVPDSPALRFSADQSFTVSAWAYIADLPGAWKSVVSKSRDAAPWYGLWISDANLWVAGGSANIAGPDVSTGWHHLAEVQDGAAGTRDLFVDGVDVASGSASDANGAGALWIGGAVSVSEYFFGLIDDVRVYDRALTANEITQAFNAAVPSTTLPLAILTQPADQVASPGDKVRLLASVNAMGLTYQWYKGSSPVGLPGTSAFVNGVSEVAYVTDALTAADNGSAFSVVFSGPAGSVTSRVAQVTVTAAVFSPGFLKREVYSGLTGTGVTDLTGAPTYPASPDESGLVGLFEAPSDVADNYGQRLSGYITPSESASYVFFLAADDNAELWLSTDDTPAAKQLIAAEPQWNPARYWVGADRRNPDAPENRSAPIRMEAGKRYYVEALHKEGTGGDDLGVTAIKAGDPDPVNGSAPVGGAFIGVLAPPTGQSISITNQPLDVTTNELAQVTFTVGAAASGGAPLAYQWQKNGTNIFKAIETSYTTPPITVADNAAKFRCVIYLPGNVSTQTRDAVLKVDTDKTPPVLVGVFSPEIQGAAMGNEVYVTFDEPVDPASATNRANYSLGAANTINAITLLANRRGVVLNTSDLAAGKDYTLTVKDVTDLSVARNRMGSTDKTFQVSDLIAHYPFDDANNLGADANGVNPGTTVGGATFSPDSRIGAGALRVNGSNGHIEVADSPLLRFAIDQSYTVGVWIKTASIAGGWRGLVDKSRNISPFYGLWLSDGALYVAGGDNINGPAVTTGWHHMAVVQDGPNSTRNLYVDGVSVASGSAIAADGTGPLWIGGAAGVTEFFNGWIDDVRIYNRALSDSEVSALANVAFAPTISLSRGPGGLTIAFTGTLQSAGSVSGSWTNVTGTASPLTIANPQGTAFYRTKQ